MNADNNESLNLTASEKPIPSPLTGEVGRSVEQGPVYGMRP